MPFRPPGVSAPPPPAGAAGEVSAVETGRSTSLGSCAHAERHRPNPNASRAVATGRRGAEDWGRACGGGSLGAACIARPARAARRTKAPLALARSSRVLPSARVRQAVRRRCGHGARRGRPRARRRWRRWRHRRARGLGDALLLFFQRGDLRGQCLQFALLLVAELPGGRCRTLGRIGTGCRGRGR